MWPFSYEYVVFMYDDTDYWHLEMSAIFHKPPESCSAGLSRQVLLARRFLDCDLLSSVEICSWLKWQKPLVCYLSKCPLCTVTLKAPAHPRSYDILKKHWRVNLSGNLAYYVIKVLSCMNSPAERKAEWNPHSFLYLQGASVRVMG